MVRNHVKTIFLFSLLVYSSWLPETENKGQTIGNKIKEIKIQDLFLDGKRAEACAAVPQELVDQVALVGSRERIADKLAEWKEAGNKRHVDTLIARTNNIETIRFLAEQVL